MIFRILVPVIAASLFFIEPTFSLFSPLQINGERYILVPHFFAVFLILLAVYDSKKTAIIYGVIFGLLYDMYHIDMIGIYTFIYPFIAYLAAVVIKHVHKYIVFVLFLAIVLLVMLELLSFLFAATIGFTGMSFEQFLHSRLIPTTIGNFFFIVLFGYIIRWFIVKRKQALEPAM